MIDLPAVLRDAMVDHAARCAPLEACGVLSADERGRLCRFLPLHNAATSPHRFLIEPPDLFEAIRTVESSGESIAGLFHSHPAGGPDPSTVDVTEWPDRRWVSFIAAPDRGGWEISLHRLEGAQPIRLAIHWTGRPTVIGENRSEGS